MKKLAQEAGVFEDVAKLWLMRQVIWQIYLPAPKHIPRPTFNVESPDAAHQADLLFLPGERLPSGKPSGQGLLHSPSNLDESGVILFSFTKTLL